MLLSQVVLCGIIRCIIVGIFGCILVVFVDGIVTGDSGWYYCHTIFWLILFNNSLSEVILAVIIHCILVVFVDVIVRGDFGWYYSLLLCLLVLLSQVNLVDIIRLGREVIRYLSELSRTPIGSGFGFLDHQYSRSERGNMFVCCLPWNEWRRPR